MLDMCVPVHVYAFLLFCLNHSWFGCCFCCHYYYYYYCGLCWLVVAVAAFVSFSYHIYVCFFLYKKTTITAFSYKYLYKQMHARTIAGKLKTKFYLKKGNYTSNRIFLFRFSIRISFFSIIICYFFNAFWSGLLFLLLIFYDYSFFFCYYFSLKFICLFVSFMFWCYCCCCIYWSIISLFVGVCYFSIFALFYWGDY